MFLMLAQNKVLIERAEGEGGGGGEGRMNRRGVPGHCTKKIHPGNPGVTFLGTDTSFAQSHPPLLEIYLIEGKCSSYPITIRQSKPRTRA